jgi:hypothetical protein
LCPIIVVDEFNLHLSEKIAKEHPFCLGIAQKKLVLSGIYDLKNHQVVFPQSPVIVVRAGILTSIQPGYGIFDYWRKFISSILTR